ncbi:hypothetical protein JW859_13535 [bacterium]|nr:hypothetical protein [bacterium]
MPIRLEMMLMHMTARIACVCCLILLVSTCQAQSPQLHAASNLSASQAAPTATATAVGPGTAASTAPVRTVSGPPDLNSAAAELHWDPTAQDFSWYYAHPGDYNQDGLVTVSDITPLGVNFNAAGPFSEDSALAMVDGNSDGLITVNDITPIGQNFSKSLERYQVFHSNDLSDYPASNLADNGAGATLLGTVQLVNNPLLANHRRLFTLHLASPPATGYAWVRPLSSEHVPGTPSNYVDLGGGSNGNTPPEAILVLSADNVAPGTEVLLIASGSSDDDGDDLTYSFDPEGDGTFQAPTTQPTLAWTYRELMDYTPGLRVDDGNGGMDEDTAALTVSLGTLTTSVVDAQSGDVLAGMNVDLVVSDGKPGVLFHDPTASETLRWRQAQDVAGTSWYDQYGLYAGGPGISAELVNGVPAVAYYTAGDLKFTYADSAGGSGTWYVSTPVIASQNSNSNQIAWPSLAIINGQPAVTSVNLDALCGGDLLYVRAVNASGGNWGMVRKIIDKEDLVTFQSSLAEVNGRPAAVFIAGTLSKMRLYYARSDDAYGTLWPSSLIITPESYYTFSDSCLEVVDGIPAVAYWDKTAGQVCYLRANDNIGFTWSDPLVISATTGSIEGDIDLAVVNNTPVIAFGDVVEGLKCFVAKDAAGTSWNDPVQVATGNDTGKSVRIADVGGRIGLAYYDRSLQQIIYAVFLGD